MPAQTIASTTLRIIGWGQCPSCKEPKTLFGLAVSLTKTEDENFCRFNDVQMCIECLCSRAPSLEVRPGDVLDLKTKNKKREINKMAQRRERECAEQIGGRTVPASGAGVAKGDARNDTWMVDDKFTKSKQYSLKEVTVVKTIVDASRTGRLGALKIGFRGGLGCEVAVINWNDFLEVICEESKSKNDG